MISLAVIRVLLYAVAAYVAMRKGSRILVCAMLLALLANSLVITGFRPEWLEVVRTAACFCLFMYVIRK